VVGTYIVGLSQFLWPVGELAVLLEWTAAVLEEVLAHLGLVLLAQSVVLAVVTVHVLVVLLLGQLAHHLAGWVVEVLLWLAVLT